VNCHRLFFGACASFVQDAAWPSPSRGTQPQAHKFYSFPPRHFCCILFSSDPPCAQYSAP